MNFKELKELAVIDWGNTSLTKNSFVENGRFLGVSAAGIDGRMDHAEHEANTLVLSAIGANCGKMFIPSEPFTAIKNTITIKPNEDVSAKYLFYYLNTFQITSRGAGQPFITKGDASKKKIPLPPLPTQQKIAAILDEADKLRQLNKQLIAKYEALTQSLFLEMFGDPVTNPKGWETKKLGDVLEITSSKRIFRNEYVESGVPFYRTKEIVELSKGNEISLELYISNERYDDIKSKFEIPRLGDILLSAVGTIGVMWTVNTTEPFYFKDGNLVWLKSARLKDLNPNYLRMTLERLIDHEKEQLAEGGAYNALTIAKLKEFSVLTAPFGLQNQFAERVQAIEVQKAHAQASLAKAEDLFNSLLQRAFKGELV